MILQMVFRDNYWHGDLHPGNIIVQHLPQVWKTRVFLPLLLSVYKQTVPCSILLQNQYIPYARTSLFYCASALTFFASLKQCCGTGMLFQIRIFIPGPGSRVKKGTASWIRNKELKYRFLLFLTQKLLLSSRNYESGCSRIRIFSYLGSRIQGS